MNFTFILWNGDIGGAERMTVALASQLRRLGHQAQILFVVGSGDLKAHLERAGVPFHALGLSRGSAVIAHTRRLATKAAELGTEIAVAPSVGYLGAAIRAGGFGGPIVGVEHGRLLRIPEQPPLRRLIERADRLLGARTHDAEVAVSKYMAQIAGNVPHATVRVIPHGVEAPGTLPPPPDRTDGFRVGYAGRLIPGKGIDRLMEAVALLRSEDRSLPLQVTLAGDGPMRRAWEDLARRLGISDRVTFLGWQDDIISHWKRCHLALAPNDTFVESFCMSMVEAMAAGRPTLVTDRGALPELVVDGVTGSVIPAGDVASLARRIQVYASDPSRLKREGAAAYERALTTYSLDVTARRYEALAKELLIGARTKARA